MGRLPAGIAPVGPGALACFRRLVLEKKRCYGLTTMDSWPLLQAPPLSFLWNTRDGTAFSGCFAQWLAGRCARRVGGYGKAARFRGPKGRHGIYLSATPTASLSPIHGSCAFDGGSFWPSRQVEGLTERRGRNGAKP